RINTIIGDQNASNGIFTGVSTGILDAKTKANFTLNIYENAERELAASQRPNLSSYTYKGAIDLNQELKGFFVRNFTTPQLISMDDNGLSGYVLKFSKVSPYGTGGNDYADDIKLDNGKISVAERTAGFYNTAAAVGN